MQFFLPLPVGLTHQDGAQNRFLNQQSDTSQWSGEACSELERMLNHVLNQTNCFQGAYLITQQYDSFTCRVE